MGDFFAGCFGKRSEVISTAVITEGGDSYNCFWQMPFRKSARVEIVNESEKPLSLLYYNIDWIKKDSLPEDAPYFYAQYTQRYPIAGGEPYTLLETTGKEATTSAPSSPCAPAARCGSARATRWSPSTARRFRRCGELAPRITSFAPGG